MPESILTKEIEILKQFGVVFHINQKIEKENWKQIKSGFDAVILATGSALENVEELGLKSAKTGLKGRQ